MGLFGDSCGVKFLILRELFHKVALKLREQVKVAIKSCKFPSHMPGIDNKRKHMQLLTGWATLDTGLLMVCFSPGSL